MVSVGDKALLFRNRDMMWLEESGSPSIGDKGFLVRNEDGNFFLKETSASVGNKGRLFNINGVNYLRSAITEKGALKWRVNLSSTVRGIAISSDGTIFVGRDGGINAINTDGTIKWSNNDSSCLYYFGECALKDDETTLYIGDDWGYMRAFDTSNGSEIWNSSDPSEEVYAFYGETIIDTYNNVYGCGSNGVVSFDSDGNIRWVNASIDEYLYQMDVDDSRLYINNYKVNQPHYCALYKDTGDFNWSGGSAAGSSVYYLDSKVYFGGNNEVVCTNQDGSVNWSWGPVWSWVQDIIADDDGNCYFYETRRRAANISNRIVKKDNNGNTDWEKNISDLVVGSYGTRNFAMDSDNLYFSTYDSRNSVNQCVFALKKSDGSINWSYKPAYSGGRSGDLSPSQDTYYSGCGSYLYAFNT